MWKKITSVKKDSTKGATSGCYGVGSRAANDWVFLGGEHEYPHFKKGAKGKKIKKGILEVGREGNQVQ